MCGIVGVCGEPVEPSKFRAALDKLRHRGPDDWGVYHHDFAALGHRRLSIIDLSVGAKQPMQSERTGAVLVFNGEIYNYLELRKELEGLGHHFNTASDTEVLLAAFTEWGRGCLDKLNGMWAFAVWDPREKTLFFSRDRFGVKPFYYLWDGKRFAFSSEPKSLVELYSEYRRVDPVALYDFLAEGNLYGHGRSFYEGIKVLPSAHCGTYDIKSGRLSTVPYWDYPEFEPDAPDLCAAAEEFRDIFEDSVRLRLRSDVEVGLTLSGGLDSTSVLAAANQQMGAPLKCFTSTYEDRSAGEVAWAELAAAKQGNPLVYAEALRDDWLDTLSRISWHMDGPGYSPAVFPLWQLMAQARALNVAVMLEGQGADELLGGYVQHSVAHFNQLLGSAVFHPSAAVGGAIASAWRGMLLTYPARKVFLRMAREAFPWLLPIYRRTRGSLGVMRKSFTEVAGQNRSSRMSPRRKLEDRANERLRHDHTYAILPGLLHYGDAISMAHGIESRNPFLDYRLVEWAFRQPASVKLAHGQTKWLVRDYLRTAGWPEFGNRWDKKGYPTPVADWMRDGKGSVPRDLLTTAGARISEFCDPKRVEYMIGAYSRGAAGAENHIYRLISTEFWLRSCL